MAESASLTRAELRRYGRHLVLPDGCAAPERWENTAVTIVERLAAREGAWHVRRLNCIAHLDDLAAQPLADSGAA